MKNAPQVAFATTAVRRAGAAGGGGQVLDSARGLKSRSLVQRPSPASQA